MQDKDLNQYNPAGSSTSKHLPCSHRLCELGSNCKNPTQPCPYNAQYYSENTSSSGMLVEDVLHLSSSSDNPSNASVQALVVFGYALITHINYRLSHLQSLGSFLGMLCETSSVTNSFCQENRNLTYVDV